MSNNYYIAEDGTIHSQPVAAENHTRTRTRQRRIATGWIVLFWVVTLGISLLIATYINQEFGVDIYGDGNDFWGSVGPWIIYIGALGGSMAYNLLFADSVNYNLIAYLLSALSSVGGMIAGFIAAVIAYVMFWIAVVILLFVGIASSCS